MPKMSDTMTEGVIASWLKKVGDEVKSGDILAEVETDKATMELEAYDDGTLLYIGIQEGEAALVDGVIAIVGEKGEDYQALLKGDDGPVAITDNDQPEKEQEVIGETVAPQQEIDTSGINATVLRMPKMSDTMTEGIIAQWLKKEGDPVKSGDILAEVETDKATMELESYDDGVLLYVGPKDGEAVAVNGILAIIGEKGADFTTLLKAEGSTTQKTETTTSEEKPETKPAPPVEPSTPQQATTSVTASTDGRIKVSPLAKKMAIELGYDLSQITGTGDNGRIVKRDIEAFTPVVASAPAAAKTDAAAPVALPPVVGEESYDEVPVSQMRKIIAKRLAESKFSAPHFYLTMEINMDKAMEARKSLNEISPVKISFNDIVVKAVAAALRQHPKVNSSWLEDKIRYNKHIHIGVAVAVDEGLLVPVVRFADNKSLSHISAEVKDLATKAVNKQLQPQDWEGNTFTISNLGMFGIEEFTAIINPPDACILAVGGIKTTPIVKDGQIVPGNVMKVTLSCDHRVVDGALGSAFLQTLKGLLEDPVRILI